MKQQPFCLPERASTSQYGYRKCGTHARVFSHTLAPENSRNEIRQRHIEEGKKRVVNADEVQQTHKKKEVMMA